MSKTKHPKFIVVDLFCGLFRQSTFLRGANTFIDQSVMCRAENPEHMGLVEFKSASCTESSMAWFMSHFQHPGFIAFARFANLREIGIFLKYSHHNRILSPILLPSFLIIPFHRIGMFFFKSLSTSIISGHLAFRGTVSTNRTTILRQLKFFITMPANPGFYLPVCILYYSVLSFGPTLGFTIYLSIVFGLKFSVTNRANFHELFMEFYHTLISLSKDTKEVCKPLKTLSTKCRVNVVEMSNYSSLKSESNLSIAA